MAVRPRPNTRCRCSSGDRSVIIFSTFCAKSGSSLGGVFVAFLGLKGFTRCLGKRKVFKSGTQTKPTSKPTQLEIEISGEI